MLGKIYVLCARTWEWDRCGGGGRSGVHSVVVGVRVEGKSLWSFFLKFFYPWNSQRHRYGETGKDPEAGGLVQSVLSPSLLPYPAFPALPMVHLMLFFFLSGKEKGWNQHSIPPPLGHDMGARWPCTLCCEHMLCHWVEPPHQIGTCRGSLQEITHVTPQSLEKFPLGPSWIFFCSHLSPVPMWAGKTMNLGVTETPSLNVSTLFICLLLPAPCPWQPLHTWLCAQEGPRALRSRVSRALGSLPISTGWNPITGSFSLQEKPVCRGEHGGLVGCTLGHLCRLLGSALDLCPCLFQGGLSCGDGGKNRVVNN